MRGNFGLDVGSQSQTRASALENNLRDNNTYMVWHRRCQEGTKKGRREVETTRDRWETIGEHNEVGVERKYMWRKPQGQQPDNSQTGGRLWTKNWKVGCSRRSRWIVAAQCWSAIKQGGNSTIAQSISLAQSLVLCILDVKFKKL